MKRRKKPILLITVLVVLLGAVIVISMPPGGFAPPKNTGDVTNPGGEAPTAESVAGDLKAHTLPAPPKLMHPMDGPSIAVRPDERGFQKPKPNPGGATASGWYYR